MMRLFAPFVRKALTVCEGFLGTFQVHILMRTMKNTRRRLIMENTRKKLKMNLKTQKRR